MLPYFNKIQLKNRVRLKILYKQKKVPAKAPFSILSNYLQSYLAA
jgi:hypothetical protein